MRILVAGATSTLGLPVLRELGAGLLPLRETSSSAGLVSNAENEPVDMRPEGSEARHAAIEHHAPTATTASIGE